MEIRALKYFLAVAKEGSITAAAEYLNITQPTLSRQMKELEETLKVQLFVRGSRCISLTPEGILLSKRAEEIVSLVNKTTEEVVLTDENIRGDLFIGYTETNGFGFISQVAKALQLQHPNITYHMYQGSKNAVIERLDKGLLDFAILPEHIQTKKYESLPLSVTDQWGVIMKKDSSLAKKAFVTSEDLLSLPLIGSRFLQVQEDITDWLGKNYDQLHIVATYNLMYDAAQMVENDLGYALSLNLLKENSTLCFRPLQPQLETQLAFVWRKHQIMSSASKEFMKTMRNK